MFLPPVAETFFINEASEASAFSFEYHITFLLHLLKRKLTVTFTNIFTLSADIKRFGSCPIVYTEKSSWVKMDQKHNKANSPHQQIGSKMKIWSDWTPFISGIYQEPRVGKQLLFGPSFMVGCLQLLVCPAPLTIRILTPLG